MGRGTLRTAPNLYYLDAGPGTVTLLRVWMHPADDIEASIEPGTPNLRTGQFNMSLIKCHSVV